MYSQQRGLDTYPCQNTWKKPELISHRHFHAVKVCQLRKWMYREKSFPVILWHKSMSQSCSDGMEASSSTTVITYWFRVSSGSVHFTAALLSERVLVCPIMQHSCFWKRPDEITELFSIRVLKPGQFLKQVEGNMGTFRTSHPNRTLTCYIGHRFWENTATLALKDKRKGQFFCRWFDH